jgi:oxygen-independent coproporphyrinogen-3 oxidase
MIQPANRVCFDVELIRRRDRNGPRYTRIPPPSFIPAVVTQYCRRQHAAPARQTAAIYVHIPFCTSPCLLRLQQGDHARHVKAEIYLHYLFHELALQASLLIAHGLLNRYLAAARPLFCRWSSWRD